MYKIKFKEIGEWIVDCNLSKEAEHFFESHSFDIPIFPYKGMWFNLREYLSPECSSELKDYFADFIGCPATAIVFSKHYIEIYVHESLDNLPYEQGDVINTFPAK